MCEVSSNLCCDDGIIRLPHDLHGWWGGYLGNGNFFILYIFPDIVGQICNFRDISKRKKVIAKSAKCNICGSNILIIIENNITTIYDLPSLEMCIVKMRNYRIKFTIHQCFTLVEKD